MARIHLHTLGCRLNLAETENIARTLRLAGHEIVDDADSSDIRVINTCTVTKAAGDESRRSARRLHDHQRIAVIGCHSELHPEEFAHADWVSGSRNKEALGALLLEHFGRDGLALGMDIQSAKEARIYPLALGNTRAFVKIQDGCDLRCSFCLTAIARGPARSRPVGEIIHEIKKLHSEGCREAVLTGVHAGSYGLDIQLHLGLLIDKILSETGIERLRLSSLEPWNFRDDWLSLWERHDGRLCRHLHMSLQSGSNSVLARMRRRYDAETFLEKIQLIRQIPGMATTTDIIAGFPGETDAEHRESLAVIEQAQFAGAHVFAFSPRPGTEAAQMPGALPASLRTIRAREIKTMIAQAEATFRRKAIGTEVTVLWERPSSASDLLPGLTDNYLSVVPQGFTPTTNTLTRARITAETASGLEVVPLNEQI